MAGSRRSKTPKGERTPTLASLLPMDQARLIVIHDAWSGMSPDSPTLTLAELKRTPLGRIRGVAWEFRRGTPEHAWDLKIDLEAASTFFRLLADAPIVTTPYAPRIDHTDDFPDISIAVQVGPGPSGDGMVLLYSSSQGEFHAPWSVSVRGQSFTSPGEEIGRALAMVRALLRGEDADVDPKAYGHQLAKAAANQRRGKRRPGEVMSRKEAMDLGGEELGPILHRLVNSKDGAPKPRAARKKRR